MFGNEQCDYSLLALSAYLSQVLSLTLIGNIHGKFSTQTGNIQIFSGRERLATTANDNESAINIIEKENATISKYSSVEYAIRVRKRYYPIIKLLSNTDFGHRAEVAVKYYQYIRLMGKLSCRIDGIR